MEENQSATQLADTRPQIDTPLRVQIPLNTPARVLKQTRDDLVRGNAFTPAALAQSKSLADSAALGLPLPLQKNIPLASINMEHDAQIKTSIKDYTMLAFSSRRAGKRDVAATAYVSLAVIHDNQGNYVQGIECYQQYLDICVECNDLVGQAVALNNLAVNHMLLASPPSDVGCLKGANLENSVTIAHLNKSISLNMRHVDIADAGGKFVAHTNLGLSFGMLGDTEQASKNHQDALRIAIKMQTLYGQSIAVGNLGLVALGKNDFVTVRTCFEQHLQLIQALVDPEAEVNAWKLLAKLHFTEGNYEQSLENLEQARKVATRECYHNELKRIFCLIGTSKGMLSFDSYSKSLVENLERSCAEE